MLCKNPQILYIQYIAYKADYSTPFLFLVLVLCFLVQVLVKEIVNTLEFQRIFC